MAEVWVKAVTDKKGDLPEVVILVDKDNNPIYYTTVDKDQVQTKES